MGVLPAHVDKRRFIDNAIALTRMNTDLSRCDPMSVARCIFGAARLGLDLSPEMRHAYIVPFGQQATLIVGYSGYIDLAYRSGRVDSINAFLVREGESFQAWIDEHGPHVRHELDLMSDGKVKAGYMVVRLRNGETILRGMSRKQIEARRNVSKAKASGPWRDWEDEMMLKTVLRNGMKVVPMSPEMATALHADDAADTGAPQNFEREALPAPPQRKGDPLLGTGDQSEPIEGEVIDGDDTEPSEDLYDDGSPAGAFLPGKEPA